MKIECEGKEDLLDLLSYIIVYAPDFPSEDSTSLSCELASVDRCLLLFVEKDGRQEVVDAVALIRGKLNESKELFADGQINPACHKLQEVEAILGGLRLAPGLE